MDSIEIEKWLRLHRIENYTINEDLSVDVEGDVDLILLDLVRFPFRFRNIDGSFYCNNNKLTSLEGCPERVSGNFDCSSNKLSDLQGGCIEVGGYYSCIGNKITTLEGCSIMVGGNFDCDRCFLKSLLGCPESVGGNFYCNNNLLITITTKITTYTFRTTYQIS